MIKVRKITDEDRAEVKKMMKFFYSSPAVVSHGSEDVFESSIKECLSDSPYLEGYVIESEGNTAGYAMLSKCYNTEYGKRCVHIEDLFIIPEFRRKGVATEFINWVREKNPESVIRLEVEKQNIPAVETYKKAGFEKAPYLQLILF